MAFFTVKQEIEALEKEIAGWEEILSGAVTETVPFHLCMRHKLCEECPVAMTTGDVLCRGSPLSDWYKHLYGHWIGVPSEFKIYCEACEGHLKLHVEFLEGILETLCSKIRMGGK